jgi:CRISPR-associated protein Cas1
MVIGAKCAKIVLDSQGAYFGIEKGCFVISDKEGDSKKYPLFEKEIGEVTLKSGNFVSTGALASCGFWDIDVMIMTQRGKPVAILKGMDDDSHVETRLAQYEAFRSEKGATIAKQLVYSKLEGYGNLLKKYGLKPIDPKYVEQVKVLEGKNADEIRQRLTGIEGKATELYFRQIFQLLPERLRPQSRKTFKAYDGINNLFNLAYEVLSWKVHRALMRAKLEPYLGFLHSMQSGKPSLVCDFQEIYRHLIDDFVIQYCQDLSRKDFKTKKEILIKNKRGKREYLNDLETKDFMDKLSDYFECFIQIPRIKVGKKQTIETLISEEALLFAKYLRDERKEWVPRLLSVHICKEVMEND